MFVLLSHYFGKIIGNLVHINDTKMVTRLLRYGEMRELIGNYFTQLSGYSHPYAWDISVITV